jgi:hypothetical protein
MAARGVRLNELYEANLRAYPGGLLQLPDHLHDGLWRHHRRQRPRGTTAYAQALAELLLLSVFIARVVSLYDRHHESRCAKG